MKFLLAVGISALLTINGLLSAPRSFGQTQAAPTSTSDFATAVQAGLQSSTINQTAQSQQQEIQNQDYKSTWDEFGTNVLIDGTTPPAEVDRKITQDVVQAIQTEENYDREEANNLEAAHLTPEEVQSIEESTGSDVPPGESIIPSPSLEANPDVNISSVESKEQNNTEASSSLPSIEMFPPSIETNVVDTATSTPEMSTSTEENSIFEAILQGEQAADQTSTPESVPAPVETPPTE